jgi:hypothetical protein
MLGFLQCDHWPGPVKKNRLLGLLWMAISAAISIAALFVLIRWLLD